jgi:hypothetical protein
MKKPPEPPNPAGRVDVLIERSIDLWMKRYFDNHPFVLHLKNRAGLDGPFLIRAAVSDRLKRERITDIRSLRKALRRP